MKKKGNTKKKNGSDLIDKSNNKLYTEYFSSVVDDFLFYNYTEIETFIKAYYHVSISESDIFFVQSSFPKTLLLFHFEYENERKGKTVLCGSGISEF